VTPFHLMNPSPLPGSATSFRTLSGATDISILQAAARTAGEDEAQSAKVQTKIVDIPMRWFCAWVVSQFDCGGRDRPHDQRDVHWLGLFITVGCVVRLNAV
jgi:hypothetical protein